ncbi:hypothetical protein DNTS_002595 [Danionella cerebrum]|uniref:Protein kinase domain-containing protein n=1 Tax=Danionella cerebrum TaxID=2873325 RepID=A0A553R5U9_9TELE|nr:hypothetical protein DNTS_002595 [Danionella translucida]
MSSTETSTGIDLLQVRIETLSSKMDRLISIQEKVLSRLDGMSQDIDGIEKDVETLKVDKEEIHFPPVIRTGPGNEMKEMCHELNSIMLAVNQRSEQQTQKLEGMEKLVMNIQQVVSFIGETVKTSKIMDVMFKGPASRKSKKAKESKAKLIQTHYNEPVNTKLKENKGFHLSLKGLKAQRKKKPPDSTVDKAFLRKQALLLEEVQKLNEENAEWSKSSRHLDETAETAENGMASPKSQDLILVESKTLEHEQEDYPKEEKEVTLDLYEDELNYIEPNFEQIKGETQKFEETKTEEAASLKTSPDEEADFTEEQGTTETLSEADITDTESHTSTDNSAHRSESDEMTISSKRRVTEEDLGLEDHKKSRVEEGQNKGQSEPQKSEDLRGVFKADGVEIELDFSKLKGESYEDEGEDHHDHFFIDCTPPPAAPFNHRVVSAKPHQISNFYTINRQEVLGGGRFGQVHKCIENSSGLTLAAKIIRAKSQKEKEVVKNEIQVMNQLDHANLIQLYAAYESRNDIILVLEYVDGGELFDRIIDENYKLTELDTVMFIRQICEGLRYMHKMYILHLDLKPENILCVSRVTNKIKIIDFGLARKYQPREKLRVNFGTPEFLSPEVVNYDFVSFNTDMWSLGVITYMLGTLKRMSFLKSLMRQRILSLNSSWWIKAGGLEQQKLSVIHGCRIQPFTSVCTRGKINVVLEETPVCLQQRVNRDQDCSVRNGNCWILH